jgi:hypothetical protein
MVCFLSHKCGPTAHNIGLRLRRGLQSCRVTLLRDPFNPGEDVKTKIETQEFHAFVFLYCKLSWQSKMCRHELKTARIRGVPVISVLLEPGPPPELTQRIYIESMNGDFDSCTLQSLVGVIRKHAEAFQAAHHLDAQKPNEETRESAQFLFEHVDPALIADHLSELARSYRPETDITTRYWIAACVGKIGSPRAAAVLKQFEWEYEPLPQRGIRDAYEMLAQSGAILRADIGGTGS